MEQLALRRLAVFDGCFDEDSARDVLADAAIDIHDVFDLLTSLFAKSLLNSHAVGAGIGFRLLETTRAYAFEKLHASGESASIESRRARLREHGIRSCAPAATFGVAGNAGPAKQP
jgi:predicted ATPase